MNCNELATAVEYKLPVVMAIFNNHALEWLGSGKNLFYDARYSATTIDRGTDFVALAKAYGAIGMNVTKPEEVDDALKEALASKDTPVCNKF